MGESKPAASRWPRWRPADAPAVAALVGLVAYLGTVSRRGLDLTDEGAYLLGARYPDELVYVVTAAFHYVGAVFELVGYDVVALRRLGLLALVASALTLAAGVMRAIEGAGLRPVEGPVGFAALTAVGSLLYYAWFLPTPSYNLLNAVALQCALGLFLLAVAEPAGDGSGPAPDRADACAAAAGAFLGLGLFVKFPTALVAAVALSGLAVVWPGGRRRRAARRLAWLALGVAGQAALHFTLVVPPSVWWRELHGGVELARVLNPGLDTETTLRRYLAELVELSRLVLRRELLPGVVLLAIAAGLRRAPGAAGGRGRGLAAGLAAMVFAGAAVFAYRRGFHWLDTDSLYKVTWFHILALGLVALVAVALAAIGGRAATRGPARRRPLAAVYLAAVLFLTPFVFSVGTSTSILACSALCLGGWFALDAWLLDRLSATRPGGWVGLAGTVFVLAFTVSQVVLGSSGDPYRLAAPLREQTLPTAVGSPATTLALDPASSRFLTGLRERLDAAGFEPGADVLNLFTMQGAIFAVGGRSPARPWLPSGYPGSAAYAEAVLARVDRERLRRAFILETPASAGDLPDLERLGLDFPAGYVLCGELEVPYPWAAGTVRIWKPRPAVSPPPEPDLR